MNKIIFKIVNVLLIIILLSASFAGFGNISNAISETVNFEIKQNAKESSTSVVASNGIDCYKEGEIVAVDLYLATPNANLTYCDIFVTGVENSYATIENIVVSSELTGLNEYITISTNTRSGQGRGNFKFDSSKADEEIYLTTTDKLKLATVYYKIKNGTSTISGSKVRYFNVECKGTIKRDTQNLSVVSSSYKYAVSKAPKIVEAEIYNRWNNLLQVGWETEFTSKVYTYDENSEEKTTEGTIQNVVYSSSDESVLKALSDGTVRAVGLGTANVIISSALDPSVYTEIEMRVILENNNDVTNLTITNPITSLNMGDSHTLQVTIDPSNPKDDALKYKSSNINVATVDNDGKITAISAGKTTITVYSSNNVTATMELEVVNPVTKVEIKNKAEVLKDGSRNKYQLIVEVTPSEYAGLVKYKTSDAGAATISDSGLLWGNWPRYAKITAYIGDVEDSFVVYFDNEIMGYQELTGFDITEKKESMKVGTSFTLKTATQPSNATNQLVNFSSSNPDIATIDSNGTIEAKAVGETTITATCGRFSDSYTLTVLATDNPLTKVELEKHNISLLTNTTSDPIGINFTARDTTQPPTMVRTLAYSSTNVNIAKVSNEGVVYATIEGDNLIIKAGSNIGTATITLTSVEDESITDTIEVTTYGVQYNPTTLKLIVGDTYQSEYLYSFLDDDEIETVTYRESWNQGVLTLDENGFITTIGEGVAGVEMTATTTNGKTYTSSITILASYAITKMSVTPKNMELVLGGEGEDFTIKYEPMEAWQDYRTYTSSDESVAKYDYDSKRIIPVGIGEAVITLTTSELGITDTINVKVICADHTDTTTIPAVASTCTTHGHAEYKVCNICGTIVSGSDSELPIDKNNHGDTYVVDAVESTCTTHGHDSYRVCKECGDVVGEITERPLMAHTGGTATCTKKAICEVCGQEYGEINSTNHVNTTVYDAVESTCTTHGHERYVKCNDCGEIIEGSDAELPLIAHTGGIATCSKKAICEVCGQEYGDFDSTNHINTEIRNAKASTTEQEGYTGDLYCKDCGTLLESGTSIAKLDKPIYEVVEGAELTYTKGEDDTATFRINGDFVLFDKVYIDDILVDPSNYTVISGSTIITFNNSFMNSLSVGKHTLKVTYTDGGEAVTTFTVAEKEVPAIINIIKTGGDYMYSNKAITLLGVLIVIAAVLVLLIKKSNNKGKH